MKAIPYVRARGALGLRVLAFLFMVAFPSHRGGAAGPPTETLTFVAIADTYVDSSAPSSNYYADDRLRIDGSPTRIAYLRFAVAGVEGRPVESTRLRLEANTASSVGGTVRKMTDTGWDESTVTFDTRPSVGGPGLDTLGAVTVGSIVEFNLDGAIPGDGIYGVAIDSTSSDGISYVSTAATGGQPPELVLTVASGPNPTVSIVEPPDGSTFFVGDPVPLQATVVDDVDQGLEGAVEWASDLDGSLGTGGIIAPTLSEGSHVVTAFVTDSDQFSGSDEIGITVVSAPAGNTEPLVSITSPLDGQTFTTTQAVALTGIATDLNDGTLTGSLSWTSDQDGPIGQGGSLTRTLSEGAHEVTASVTDSGGLEGTATVSFNVVPPDTLEFIPVADTYVDQKQPTTNYGSSTLLRVCVNSERTTYLRFAVSGVGGRTVTQAILLMDVDADSGAGSDNGGTVRRISNTTWQEGTLTYNTRPAVDGPALASTGAVAPGQIVDFDVSAAITGDGDYNFAIVGSSTDGVKYRSKEAGAPKLVLVLAGNPPSVTVTAPANGAVVFTNQLPLRLTGTATDPEDGNLSSQLVWRSDRDGALGTGTSITVGALSIGQHSITAAVRDSDNLTGQSAITIRVRTPNVGPVVSITAPGNGTSVVAGSTLGLAATVSDDFDGNLGAALAWSSSRDGALGTGAALTVTLSEGSHTITASVTDSDGASGSSQVSVNVMPTPPVVTVAAPASGTIVSWGNPVTFMGTASDATDGNLSAGLVWTSNLAGQIGTGATLSTTALTQGTHTVTAAVTDSGGLSGSAQITLVVRPPNQLPVLTINAPANGAAVLAGQALLLSATATDTEDGNLSGRIVWTSNVNGTLGTGASLTVTTLTAATHVLTASVTDLDGALVSASVMLTVGQPTLSFVSVADTYVDGSTPDGALGTETTFRIDTSPVREAYVRFAVTGVAPFAVQRAILRLTVGPNSGNASAVGGTVRGMTNTSWTEATTRFSNRPAIDGPVLATKGAVKTGAVVDFDVTAAVKADGAYSFGLVTASSDAAGYNSREATSGKPQLILTLKQNTGPTVNITAPPTETTVLPDVSLALSGTATDAEDGTISAQIQWRSNLKGPLGAGASITVRLDPGAHTITAAATDSSGASSQAEITVTVGAPPDVVITEPADGSMVFTDELPLALRGTASDDDDGDLGDQIAWTSSLDGSLGTGGSITAGRLSIGLHTITAAVTDSHNLTGRAQITVRVRNPNVGPNLTISAPANGTAVPAGMPLDLAATVSDDFDTNLGSQVTWMSDVDGPLGRGTSLTVILSEGSQILTASVVDSDGAGDSAQVSVEVTPTPPVVSVLSPPDGATIFVGDSLTFAGSASDATDGDVSAGLVWTSDLDGEIGTGAVFTSTTLTLGRHAVSAAVTDTGGLPGQALVAVVVRPPNEPPVLTIDAPANGVAVLAGQALVLRATATDTEDGNLGGRIAWTSNINGTLGTGASLTVTTLTAGTHVLRASVTDLDGAPASASVMVTVGQSSLSFVAVADTYVDAGTPTLAPGRETTFRIDGSPVRQAYLRFVVTGVPPFAVEGATLRLTVGPNSADASNIGGTIHSISDNTWSEATTTFNKRPAVDGPALATRAAVKIGDVVNFDVTAAVLADGTYNFAMVTTSSDAVGYNSREATSGRPLLILTLKHNAEPVVNITAPASGMIVPPGEPLTLTGVAVDVDDGDLSGGIEWRSYRDGVLGTGAALTVSTLSDGPHVITAAVTDSSEATTEATVEVIIDAPPVVRITSPAGGSHHFVTEPVTLTATAIDRQDGDLSDEITWTSSLDGALGAGASITRTTLSLGTHTITAAATDSRNLTGNASLSITVEVNDPPTVAIMAPPELKNYVEGTTATFRGEAVDPEQGDISTGMTWTSSLDGPLGTGAVIVTSSLSVGRHVVTAAARDNRDLEDTDTVTVTVEVNDPPVVTITAPADGVTVHMAQAVTFTGSVADPEDGNLTAALVWRSDRDGQIGTGGSFGTGTLSIGTHLITATVTDTLGLPGSAEITIQVINDVPAVSILQPANGTSTFVGNPVLFAGTVNDTEDGDLTAGLIWRSNINGPLGTASGFMLTTLSIGTHVISAEVTDRGGATGSGSITLIVKKIPNGTGAPVVRITAPAPSSVFEFGDPVTFTASAIDPDDGDIGTGVIWTSDVSGAFGAGASVVIDNLPIATHWIRATVADSHGVVRFDEIDLVIEEPNEVPVVTITAPLGGTEVNEQDQVVFGGTATDLEDGDLSASLEWTSDIDGPIGSGGSFTIATLSPGTHVITATSTDRKNEAGTAEITVVVHPIPVVTILVPLDGTGYLDTEPVSFFANADDLGEGDVSASLIWTSDLDGPIGTGQRFTVEGLTVGIHTVTAVATNSRGAIGTAKATFMVSEDTLIIEPVADVTVDQALPTTNLGAAADLMADAGPSVREVYLRFVVNGIDSFPVDEATLELHVTTDGAADSGGFLKTFSNNTWTERGVTYATRPTIDGPTVASADLAVDGGDVVDFDVTGAIAADGTYNFALRSSSTNAVRYKSREAAADHPRLVVVLSQPDTPELPELTITSPATGSVVFDDTPVTFTATASDPEDGNLTGSINWRSNLDGTLGSGGTVTRRLSCGTHTVFATVRDSFGLAATGTVTITVVDRPPLITITAPPNGRFFPSGLPVTFSATATDDLDSNLSATIQWTSHRDGLIGTGASFTTATLSSGDHMVVAAVTNSLGTRGTGTITIFIDHAPPVITIESPPDGTTVTQGTPITLVGSATDVEDGDLSNTIAWSSSLEGALGTGATLPVGLTIVGTHRITAAVTDSHGLTRTAEIHVSVSLAPPVVTILSPADGAEVAGSIGFSGRAVGVPDGDLSSRIQWRSSKNGALGTGSSIPPRVLSAGIHIITAQVTNGNGLLGSASISIVVGTAPPIVQITRPVSSGAPVKEVTVTLGDAVTFAGTAADVFGVSLSNGVAWSSDLNGSLGTGSSITVSSLLRGRHVITAAATDARGIAGFASIAVVVTTASSSTPPDVNITAPGGGTVVVIDTPTAFRATALDDLDGDVSSSLTWVSNLDGLLGTGSSISATMHTPGAHTITAAARNALGLVGVDTVSISVVPTSVSFGAVADVNDDQSQSTTNFGASEELQVDLNPVRRTFLRFVVSGTAGRLIRGAEIRLQTSSVSKSASDDGGTLYPITNNTWGEMTLTYQNSPAINRPAIASAGPVVQSQTVSFDVSSVVAGDGTYSFALASTSTNLAIYRSREAGVGSPRLVIFLEPPAPQKPVVDIIQPADLATLPTGVPVVFRGIASDVQNGNLGAAIIWRSDVQGILGIGSSITPTLTPGTHVITATVNDIDGNSGADLIHIQVGNSPVVVIERPTSKTSVAAGQRVLFAASAFDPQDGDLSFFINWRSNIDGPLGTGAAISTVLSPGTHTVTASAQDTSGNTGSATVSIVATVGDVGFQDFLFGAADQDNNRITGSKPESKLWYTEDGIWWATLYLPSSAAYTMHRLNFATHAWVNTGIFIDERPTSRQDALLDGRTLYIASRMTDPPGQNRLLRYTYHPEAQTFVPDPGFPANIPGGGTESMTIAKDSTGRLWLAFTLNDQVMVSHSLASDMEWADPFLVPIADENPNARNIYFDDIAGIIAIHGAVGVFWSNQLTKTDYFAVHTDGTAPSDPASWRLEVAASGNSVADDHFNLKVASDGRLFALVKTSRDSGGTLMGLLVRSPGGTWSPLHHINNSEFKTTRPAMLLDEVRRKVRVFYSPFETGIYTKVSDMDTIAFPDPNGIGTPFITRTTGGFLNNPTTTKQNVNPSTGFVVMAASLSRYYHNGHDPQPGPVVTIASPADGRKVALGASISFSATAFSVADGVITSDLTWTSSLGGMIGTGGNFSTRSLSAGVHVIRASVTDSKLATGSATITVTVEPEAAPVVSILQPGAGAKFLLGEPILFTGTALDSLDGDLTASLRWSSNRNGTLGTGGSILVTSLSSGTHTITAQATDSAGRQGTASISIELQAAAPPTLHITSPANGVTVAFGAAVPFAGTATDEFNGNITASIKWTSDRDGAIGTGGSFTRSSLSRGVHTITASVTDSHGLTGRATVRVTVN